MYYIKNDEVHLNQNLIKLNTITQQREISLFDLDNFCNFKTEIVA